VLRRCVWSRNIKNGCSIYIYIYIYIYDISRLRVNLLNMWKNESTFLSNALRFAISRLRPFVHGKTNFAIKVSKEHSSNEIDSGKTNSSEGDSSPRATVSTTNAIWTDPAWNPGSHVYRLKLTWIILEHWLHTAQQKRFFSSTKTKSVLCRQIIGVSSEMRVKHTNALWG